MVFFYYPLVSGIGASRYRIADIFPNRVFKYFKLMFAAFDFPRVNYLQAVPFDDDLCLQRMPFFSSNNTLFDPF
jgi:hypothetical protein